ncbi:MAG TPA: 6-carboxytetrahydropterin synthase QueD [Desulfobacteraceae bacterium]|nr:6-carboxytetrahydropterin synthase QueD [Desulfobacteraceae bacterium]
MYEVSITSRFSAAHQLEEFEGGCERLHGHNWKVEVTVGGSSLDGAGLVMDFRELKKHTGEIINTLDHNFLNELEAFRSVNPSSENIARYLFDNLSDRINNDRLMVTRVRAWESEDSCASYAGS